MAIAEYNTIIRAKSRPNIALAYTNRSKLDEGSGIGATALILRRKTTISLLLSNSIYIAKLYRIRLALA